jgi:hypothetical protein
MRLLASPKAAAVASSFHRYYADISPSTHWVNNSVPWKRGAILGNGGDLDDLESRASGRNALISANDAPSRAA